MSSFPSQAFREYDIRGVADRDLSDEVAEGIGRALAGVLGKDAKDGRPRLAVGRDSRLSSPRLHAALLKGLTAHGAHVIDIGIGPTPMLYFGVFHTEADGGVMITGSHNPGDENGFKIMKGKKSFFGPDIVALREKVIAKDFGPERPGTVETLDVQPAYVEEMKKRFDFSNRKKPKFVLDSGNGSGGPLGVRTMKALGLAPDTLFEEMDGHFPNHHPDPTVAKNLEALIKRVKETGAQLGLAYDGDADRLGAVEPNGNIIWGDKLMILFSRALLKTNPGATVIGEVKCSQTMYDDIAKHGGNPIIWKTGHSLIKTKMKETGALLAGEMSGHLFFADRYYGYDDAIYAGLRLLEIVADSEQSITEMLADVPQTFMTPELRIDCPDAIKFAVVKGITERYKAKGMEVLDIDGARIKFPTTGIAPKWGLVRASNTGPILVMRVEAGTEKELLEVKAELDAAVAEERAKHAAG